MSTDLSPNFSKTISVVSAFILGFSSLSSLTIGSISVYAAGQLIINEFVPAPSSRSCSSFGNQETVELFNSGDEPIDYRTFSLRDKSGIVRNLTSGVTIHNSMGQVIGSNLVPVGGYLVFRTAEGWLNNTTQGGATPSDGVYLYDNGVLVDSQDYNITDGAMGDVVFRKYNADFIALTVSSFGRSNFGTQDLNCPSQSSSSSSLMSSSRSSVVSSSNNSSNNSSSVASSTSTSSLSSSFDSISTSSQNSQSSLSSSSSISNSNSSSNSSVANSSLISSNGSLNNSSSNSNSSIGQFGNLKVCKEDNLKNKLSNWEFNVKNTALNQNLVNLTQKTQTSGTSTVVQTLSIDSQNSGTTPSIDLPAGNYSLKISGKYTYGSFDGKPVEADAAYSFRPIGTEGGTDTWISGDNLPSQYSEMLKVRANNQNLDFGVFNPEHVYTTQISKGNGPINFSINDTGYEDNTGSLNIEITRIAETNGCTTFFNLPYGQNYTVTETMQPNWSFVTATSNSEMLIRSDNSVNQGINQNETILTFVNKFTSPIVRGGGTGQIGGGNILAPVSQTQQTQSNSSQNNNNSTNSSTKPTAVKGIEDNESDKNSSNSLGNIISGSQQNSANNSNNPQNIEYRIRLVEQAPIETEVISTNGQLIRTGGVDNLQFVSSLIMILMGTGLYFSFRPKFVKKSTEEQL